MNIYSTCNHISFRLYSFITLGNQFPLENVRWPLRVMEKMWRYSITPQVVLHLFSCIVCINDVTFVLSVCMYVCMYILSIHTVSVFTAIKTVPLKYLVFMFVCVCIYVYMYVRTHVCKIENLVVCTYV